MAETVGTLTRADLADTMNRRMGFSRSESLELVESLLNHMCEALSKGENVKVSGFGSFILRDKAERIGRNPKTGVEVPITSRRVLTFRASQLLKQRIDAAA
ncbi:integration host factor subunit alpha [Altererythrobacter sp. SALINAS58]|uniref:integration host factor subunit alpha n=1 Tax=Alteripontixanthobacter muriae TaxID=2705546 RepID=UPI0015752406|nr:integration host factor subunit alpha [Alteripontixanthobacter muriae]NTZ42769.1 integration host factor subunit alpha [Alteripontixanthobacter muriae]